MNILVTGSEGFIGRNLVESLKNVRDGKDLRHAARHDGTSWQLKLMEVTRSSPDEMLERYCEEADFVFCLAGTNRSQREEEFIEGNTRSLSKVLELIRTNGRKTTVMYASSIQASLTGRYVNSVYGRSKRKGEELVRQYGKENGTETLIYRFANVFGKWCRTDCHSVIATFCSHISRDEAIHIDDPKAQLRLIYIDDLMEELLRALDGRQHMDEDGYCMVKPEYRVCLGDITELLYKFKDIHNGGELPPMPENSFEKRLYSTYVSYMPSNALSYPLQMHTDARGSFTELLRTETAGQFSLNVSRPGVTKGGHWHHTKTEKFVVVSGSALIRLQKISANEVGTQDTTAEYHVSGKAPEVVDIPPGYLHYITNEGETDLITLMWSNECFDPREPDTFVH